MTRPPQRRERRFLKLPRSGLKQASHPYVSRGGIKLEGAVRAFGLDIHGKVCLDVGSSTGGFTHYLLLNGALRVYALDVDVNQLDWKVRNDARLRPVEMNARFLEPGHIGELWIL